LQGRTESASAGAAGAYRDTGEFAPPRIQQPDGELPIRVAIRGKFRRDLRSASACGDAASAALPFCILEALRPVRNVEEIPHDLTLSYDPADVVNMACMACVGNPDSPLCRLPPSLDPAAARMPGARFVRIAVSHWPCWEACGAGTA
jgi:hypothetical protein